MNFAEKLVPRFASSRMMIVAVAIRMPGTSTHRWSGRYTRIPNTVRSQQRRTTTADTMNVPFLPNSHDSTPVQPAFCAIGSNPNDVTTNAPAAGNASQNSSWHAHGTVNPTAGCSERLSYR